ncbi:MAG: Holliday junction DNA helicase RuvA [Gemmatimonadetes bacterium 13_1_40CM_4_69_8]|nr:MAG: Holliday junction DNA helicase RuvA [Gemmatimonadetes bacterium 13_1_40CM_70_15]OLC78825.1 MAG: Holliday junction DNA helicase RuvA [Gemmatimonadetes bacterium 13_1_40CM_4_69_8]PYP72208.1 MAG: Holliday junction branch migration protein RuvA [Gemmatimonadota bacterium]
MIASVAGRLAAKSADRVVVQTSGGVGYEVVVPLGVMEQLSAVGEPVTLATELVVREDGWALYGFLAESERRFFQRLTSVTGVGPKLAIALLSALGADRGAKAIRERNIGLLSSVSGIGKKTAERLALELADKVGEFVTGGESAAVVRPEGAAEAALQALERLGYSPGEADRALRQTLADDGDAAGDIEQLVRRALQLLTHG